MGEQDNQLETLTCYFAKLRGYKLLQIKVQVLVIKAVWDAKRWNPWESKESKEDVVVIDSETEKLDKMPRAVNPDADESKSTATIIPASEAAPSSGDVRDKRIYAH